VRLAGHLAQALRPAGYDGEAVYLIAALQSLGRLLVRYHFADEAEQIHQLMQPIPAVRVDGETTAPEQPGLGEAAAAYAVLGVDIEALGSAAARHWGLGDEVLHMIRRLPGDAVVRKPDNDNELLRIVASAANEIVDALGRPAAKVAAALNQVIGRYARTLRLTTRNVQDAIEDAREALQSDGMRAAFRPAGEKEERIEESPDDAASESEAPPMPDAALQREQHG
jgi:non-specific serine/threonine protein kinase